MSKQGSLLMCGIDYIDVVMWIDGIFGRCESWIQWNESAMKIEQFPWNILFFFVWIFQFNNFMAGSE